MAKCRRGNCNNYVFDNPDAKKKYLCEAHYEKRLKNIQIRFEKSRQKCARAGCNNVVKKRQNSCFCSNDCRWLSSRIINNGSILKIIKHSYWLNVERFIKSNPKGIASINTVTDISDIINLYQIKAKYQRSYVEYKNKNGTYVKLTPFIKLELCHFYPNSKGGDNIALNILIAPEKINRKRSNIIPLVSDISVLNGVNTDNKAIKINTTLYKFLVENLNENKLNSFFYEVGKLKKYFFYKKRDIDFAFVIESGPFENLLFDESKRIGLNKIIYKFLLVKSLFIIDKIYVEILAICIFYSFLSGDENKLIKKLLSYDNYVIRNNEKKDRDFVFIPKDGAIMKKEWVEILEERVFQDFNEEIVSDISLYKFYYSFFSRGK